MNWIIHKEVSLVINFYGDDIQPVHCLHTMVVKVEGDEYIQWGATTTPILRLLFKGKYKNSIQNPLLNSSTQFIKKIYIFMNNKPKPKQPKQTL
jgi:hypothetical protein